MSTAAATASASAPETVIENEVVGGNDLPMTFKVRVKKKKRYEFMDMEMLPTFLDATQTVWQCQV